MLYASKWLTALCLFSPFAVFAEEHFILMNGATSEVLLQSGSELHLQVSPCSTFKIPLSLMGYDAGILKDAATPVWDFQDGYDDDYDAWKNPISPQSWMQYSCIWYSKVLALELGQESFQKYLAAFDYGNQDSGKELPKLGPVNPSWVASSLKISPQEQVGFLQKMLTGTLPVSSHAIAVTKELLFKEELAQGWKLYGKTGWGGSAMTRDGSLQIGWFVGWVEKEASFFPFAYLIREKKIPLEQRIPRTKQLLVESKIFEL